MRGTQMTEIRGIAYNGGAVGYSILCGETSGGVVVPLRVDDEGRLVLAPPEGDKDAPGPAEP